MEFGILEMCREWLKLELGQVVDRWKILGWPTSMDL